MGDYVEDIPPLEVPLQTGSSDQRKKKERLVIPRLSILSRTFTEDAKNNEVPPTAMYNFMKLSRRFIMEDVRLFEMPVATYFVPQPKVIGRKSNLLYSDKIVYFGKLSKVLSRLTINKRQVGNTTLLEDVTTNSQTLLKTQRTYLVNDLAKAVSSRSTLISFPIDVKLTDKHLAQMPLVSESDPKAGFFWPQRWQFDDSLGSFLCVVKRINKNTYEFKVLVVPGPFNNDPAALSMLMNLFNPMYQPTIEGRDAVLLKAKMMICSAANEFFGPQIVELCLTIWNGIRCNLEPVHKKKNNMIMNRGQMYDPATDMQSPTTDLKPLKPRRPAKPSTSRSKIMQPIITSGNILTDIFSYDSDPYPTWYPVPQVCTAPKYSFVREIYVNEDQLRHLLADCASLKLIAIYERTKG